MEALLRVLADPSTLSNAVIAALAVLGLMQLALWFFREFVTWSHKMRLLARKLTAEPDSRLIND